MHPPPLLLRAEKKRSAVHGVGEEEGWGADEDGPVLLQDGFLQGSKHGRNLVQTRMPRPSLSAAAPLERTPPLAPPALTGELAGRAAARLKGRAPGFRKNSPPPDGGGAAIAAEGEIPPGFQ